MALKSDLMMRIGLKIVEKSMQLESKNSEAKNLKFANLGNHTKAQMASFEPNLEVIKYISLPCLIIHGKENPIFPIDHAKKLTRHIKNSKLLILIDMGYALNPYFFDNILDEIVTHINISKKTLC